MRFATITERLGVNFISAILTLIAFLPVLLKLSSYVTELPIVGAIPYPLVVAAIVWSIFGTGLLALIGIKLPGIEFFNQRVEAAYRKELVLGEDNADRADPPTLSELFQHIRKNYFRLYLNYLYFNVGRIAYLQTDVIFPYILLAPTIIAGKLTLGPMQQILNAFTQVRTSFQIPDQLLDHDRRPALGLQAPARIRSDDRRRTAAGHRGREGAGGDLR